MECEDLKVSGGHLTSEVTCCSAGVELTSLLLLPLCLHQELPRPLPVNTRLPAHLFGDALMVLEFLWAFGEVFDLKNEFPDGVSLGENLKRPIGLWFIAFMSTV